jgi:hypothetical protein
VRTFIVRLQEDAISGQPAGVAAPRLCGVVDEVSTGTSATFRNDRELIATLAAAIGAHAQEPLSSAGRRRSQSEPAPDHQEPDC